MTIDELIKRYAKRRAKAKKDIQTPDIHMSNFNLLSLEIAFIDEAIRLLQQVTK